MSGTRFKISAKPIRVLAFIAMGAMAILAFGGVVMLLWNAILPGLLKLPLIGYWQAVGLLILCKILFGGMRPGGGRKPFGGPPQFIKSKFMQMSDEEKQAFKEEFRKRCAERKK